MWIPAPTLARFRSGWLASGTTVLLLLCLLPLWAQAEAGASATDLAPAGTGAFATGDYALAREQRLAARAQAEREGDLAGLARATVELGMLDRRQGRFDLAASAFASALALFRQLGDRDGEATALTHLGLVHLNQGHFAAALEVLDTSLDLQDEGAQAERDRTLHYLGLLYRQLGEFEQANEFLKQGLDLAAATEDPFRQAPLLGSLARVANDIGQPAEAIAYATRARVLNQQQGNRPGLAYDGLERGRALLALGRLDEAGMELRATLALSSELGQRPSEADAHLALAQLAIIEARPEAAREHLEAALLHYRGGEESARAPRLLDTYRLLIPLLRDAGEHPAALELAERSLDLQQQLAGSAMTRRLTLLEHARQRSDDRRRIELLTRDNELQALRLQQERQRQWIGLSAAAGLVLALVSLGWRYRQLRELGQRLARSNVELERKRVELDAAHAELQDKAQALYRASITDELTGMSNRRHVLDELADLLADPQRRAEGVAVLLVDVDHFKQVNDRHGHGVGDAVLVRVARLMQAQFGERPCGRLGGEEFIAVLPGAGLDQARSEAEQLRLRIAEVVPGLPAVTASIGVASGNQLAGPEAAQGLIEAADGALYAAKRGGRDRVSCAPQATSLLH